MAPWRAAAAVTPPQQWRRLHIVWVLIATGLARPRWSTSSFALVATPLRLAAFGADQSPLARTKLRQSRRGTPRLRQGAAPEAAAAAQASSPPPSLVSRLVAWLRKPERRKKLASLGVVGALSYWVVKLLKHSVLFSISWYVVAARTGASPLQRWPNLLSVYASLYLTASTLQPLKFAAVVAFTPGMGRMLEWLALKFSIRKRSAVVVAFFTTTVLGLGLGTLGVMAASFLAGTPIW
mmetsp:Transcript_58732/g.163908  ORF Transcript_58732/g.163908 Transcript_58732/m.163908 type:complete len:237 (-) Transcript_58732:122-832(-)